MKIVHIVGIRPQFIKVSALCKAIARHNKLNPKGLIKEVIIHTGQHYDKLMSDMFFESLNIPRPKSTLCLSGAIGEEQIFTMVEWLRMCLKAEKPDVVVVYGDANTALAGAKATFRQNIPLAHVEAGLRSYNLKMPEETNRVVIDHLSDWLFCPSATAVENLKKEDITEGVYQVGDVMLDTLQAYSLSILPEMGLRPYGLQPLRYYLATIHRQENVDDVERAETLFRGLGGIKEYPVVVPLHPRTKHRFENRGRPLFNAPRRVIFVTPLPYLSMLCLEKYARAIITDSGGVQKEAYYQRTPCITLRNETEWPETVDSGWNTLVGDDIKKMLETIETIETTDYFPFHYPKQHPDFYGDGHASEKIVEILSKGRQRP